MYLPSVYGSVLGGEGGEAMSDKDTFHEQLDPDFDEAVALREAKNPWPTSFTPNVERSLGRAEALVQAYSRPVFNDSKETQDMASEAGERLAA